MLKTNLPKLFVGDDELLEFQNKIHQIMRSEMDETEKQMRVASLQASFQIQGDKRTQNLLRQGFVVLAVQNEELQNQNAKLLKELKSLKTEFDVVSKTLQARLYEEQLSEERKARVRNRTRVPKRDPITKDTYEFLIEESESMRYYTGARLRIALAILQVTGIRVSELLSLKVKDIDNLFKKNWVGIDRKKHGPANHKAFLSPEGRSVMKARKGDFEILTFKKDPDCFLFTGENSDKALRREVMTKSINNFLRSASKKMEGSPNLKSHSFRFGYITQLWKDTQDIEFVKQSIGHQKLDTTSQYVKKLTDSERQQIMERLGESN